MGGIRILTDSPMTTVQDAGRFGMQGVGVPVSGPADPDAHALAQLLVGNDARAAGLELTLTGPAIEFLQDNNVAITGGDFAPRLDGMPISNYRAVHVHRGQVLSFDGRRSGFRAYLAFSGGLDVPLTMGSRATHLPSGMGGLEGRKLRKGDELGFLCPGASFPIYPCRAAVPRASTPAARQFCAWCSARRRTASRPPGFRPSSHPRIRCSASPAAWAIACRGRGSST